LRKKKVVLISVIAGKTKRQRRSNSRRILA
jgi:hypothetical protein